MSSSASSISVCANFNLSSLTSSGVSVARTPRRLASRVSLAIAAMAPCGTSRKRSTEFWSSPSTLETLTFAMPWTCRGMAPLE
jgi:hypothetical protein